jgi:hypothetical protein
MKINYLTIILATLVVLLVANTLKGCQDAKELKILNEALDAEIVVWKDKDGLNNAKIVAFESRDSETFINLQTQDTLIKELQDEVKKANLKATGSSITIIEGETKIDTVFVNNDNIVYSSLFNTPLHSGFSNEWISADFSISLDSLANNTFKVGETTFQMTTKNKYIVTLDREKGRLTAKVKNLNPYSETTAMRAFQVKDAPRGKFSFGAFLGPGVLLSQEPKAGLVAGAGLNYKF